MTKKEYLGDGVYADIDAGMIILTVEDGEETLHTINLEPEVFQKLIRFNQDNQE